MDSQSSAPRPVAPGTRGFDLTRSRRAVRLGMLRLTALLNEAVRNDHGLSANSEIVSLVTLRLSGAQRARDLTRVTQMTRAGTTNMIDRLEAARLVQRDTVDEDQRGVLVSLTPEGASAIEVLADRATRVVTEYVPTILSWDQHLLEMGFDVGSLRLPAGSVDRRLDWMGRLAGIGPSATRAYTAAFGDLTAPHHHLHLLLLATEPGGTRPALVSEATLLSSASTSDLLRRAEAEGLITRTSGEPPDRRVTVVDATDAGRAALQIVLDDSDDMMREIAEHFFPTEPKISA